MGREIEYTIKIADHQERDQIYKIRHDVYAVELKQHKVNKQAKLMDDLDSFNIYIVAKKDRKIAGFLSITPPWSGASSLHGQASSPGGKYSMDKYLAREKSPFTYDNNLYEVRILTIIKEYRNLKITLALMYAAGKWIENEGGKSMMILGRVGINDIYKKIGFQSTGIEVQAGEVRYDVMSSATSRTIKAFEGYSHLLDNIYRTVNWSIGVPFYNTQPCYHGGSFFKAIGDSFDNFDKRQEIINADVLDAWFDPCPEITEILKNNINWILKTSPPTYGEGLVHTISEKREIPEECVLINNGSSSLMYLAFNTLLNQHSRVLVFDPSYGEYLHIFENVIQCKVDRYRLDREQEYSPDLLELKKIIKEKKYDLVVLVNPNNPSGKYIPQEDVLELLNHVGKKTLIWIDETYIDYVGPYSLEPYVKEYSNLIICKSMSKAYALSGVRVAYLCAHPLTIKKMKPFLPPWPVSLPAQIAAVKALSNREYYLPLYTATHENRKKMVAELKTIKGLNVIEGMINSLLIFPESRDVSRIFDECKKHGLHIRPFYNTGKQRRDCFLRIAVKDEETNREICRILKQVITGDQNNGEVDI